MKQRQMKTREDYGVCDVVKIDEKQYMRFRWGIISYMSHPISMH